MSAPKYCDDPDNCAYSDCPTAFCDRNRRDHSSPEAKLPTVKFTVELSPDRAMALAQFLKRAHFGTCERLSDLANPKEPQLMMDALETVRHELACAGYAPR